MFARFGTRLDKKTRATIERGRRVRKILTQPELQPLTIPEQIAVLLSVTEGLFDPVELEALPKLENLVKEAVTAEQQNICEKIESGEQLTEDDQSAILDVARRVVDDYLSSIS